MENNTEEKVEGSAPSPQPETNDFEERRARAEQKLAKILEEDKLAIGAQLQFAKTGIAPMVVWIDAEEKVQSDAEEKTDGK